MSQILKILVPTLLIGLTILTVLTFLGGGQGYPPEEAATPPISVDEARVLWDEQGIDSYRIMVQLRIQGPSHINGDYELEVEGEQITSALYGFVAFAEPADELSAIDTGEVTDLTVEAFFSRAEAGLAHNDEWKKCGDLFTLVEFHPTMGYVQHLETNVCYGIGCQISHCQTFLDVTEFEELSR